MMQALDAAKYIVATYAETYWLTNAKLNHLLSLINQEYYLQQGKYVFNEATSATIYGAVYDAVCDHYKKFGVNRIKHTDNTDITDITDSTDNTDITDSTDDTDNTTVPNIDETTKSIIDDVMAHLGDLSVFDLLCIAEHRVPGVHVWDGIGHTFTAGINDADRHYPNALRMLENT